MDSLRRKTIVRIKNDASEIAAAISVARQRGFILGDIELCHALDDVYDISMRASNTAALAIGLLEASMDESVLALSNELRAEAEKHLATLRRIADGIEQMYADSIPAQIPTGITVPYHSQWDTDAQRFRSDCGPACVAMLLSARGIHRSVDELSAACGMNENKRYTTAPDLAFVAGLSGLDLQVIAGLNAEQWVARAPAIVLVHYGSIPDRLDTGYTGGHWVVVIGGDDKTVQFHDPDWWGDRRDEGAGRRVPIQVFDQALRDCAQDSNPVGYGLA